MTIASASPRLLCVLYKACYMHSFYENNVIETLRPRFIQNYYLTTGKRRKVRIIRGLD